MPDNQAAVRSAVELVRFDLFREIRHGIGTRHGGRSTSPYASLNMGLSTGDDVETVWMNRRMFLDSLGVPPKNARMGRLSHGAKVSVFREDGGDGLPTQTDSTWNEQNFDSDAAISQLRGAYFLLTFADCVPLVFYDRKRGVIGAAHAGWRGTAAGIADAVVQSMIGTFGTDPGDLVVGIGPSVGPCCYDVQENVLAAFRASGTETTTEVRGDRTYLDLWSTNEHQLLCAGMKTRNIETLRVCTSCNVDRFYSHRAEGGRTGRFALCIGLD